MTILDRIKNKAQQALQGIGNFIDRDQSMEGVQLAQGGLGNRINQVARDITNPQKVVDFLGSQANKALEKQAEPYNLTRRYQAGEIPREDYISRLSEHAMSNPLIAGITLSTPEAVGGKVVNSLDEILRGNKPEVPAVVPRNEGMVTSLPKRPANTMYTTPEGTTFKVNKQPKTTASLDKVLGDVDQAIRPEDKIVVETAQKLLPAPQKVPLLNEMNGRPMPKFTPPMPEPVVPPVQTAKVADAVVKTSKGKFTKAFDAVVKPSLNVIEKSGQSGKQAATLIRQSEEQGARLAGDWLDGMTKALNPLSDVEKAALADVIEGRIAPTSQAQQNAANTWRYIANQLREKGTQAGLDIGKLDNYFPHVVDESQLTPALKEQLAQAMGRTGQRRYGNLELPRELNAPYSKDPAVLLNYIENAARRVTDAQNFGAADEKLYELAKKAGFEGGDTLQLNTYLDQILGKNGDPRAEAISKTLRSVQQFKLSPITSLRNLTQNISTVVRTDPQSVGLALKKIITNPEEARSIFIRSGESGVEFEQALKEISGASSKYVKGIGMGVSEKANRLVAVNSGYEYASKLATQVKGGSKAALRELERLGFSAEEIGQGLTGADFITAGRRVSQATQFSTKAGELPFGWSTPAGKVITQFKPFAYKQTGFIKDLTTRVASEATKGNFKPLMSVIVGYGMAAPIAGEFINTVKSLITNKKRSDTDSLAERYVSDSLTGFSLGLTDSLPSVLGEYGPKGVISGILGPTAGTVSDAAEVVGNTPAFLGGDEQAGRKIGRNVLKQIPVVGQTISNTVVPNSYVENYVGPNKGMNAEDTNTYNLLKESDPAKAEQFKQSRSNVSDNPAPLESGGSVVPSKTKSLKSLFGLEKPNTLSIPKANATSEEKKKFRSDAQSIIDQGGTLKPEEWNAYLLKGKSVKSSSLEEKATAYSSLKTALDSDAYTDEQKQQILEASGADPKEYQYYDLASKGDSATLQTLLPKFDNMEPKDVVKFLMQGRKVVAGKQLTSNAMVDYLYENNYITKADQAAIKALKYDEIQNKFYFSKSYSNKGSMSYKQAAALYKIDLPKFSTLKDTGSLLKGAGSSQTGQANDKLLENILSGNRPNQTKKSNLWF